MDGQGTFPQRVIGLIVFMVISGFVLLLASGLTLAQANTALDPAALLAAPDLIVESIEYSPQNPNIGESVDITITIKNQGDLATGTGFYTYLYVDPAVEPPEGDTPDTSYNYMFGLGPGASYRWTYMGYTFAECGSHPVWAWTDKRAGVVESDETNNMNHVAIPVCQTGDAYEPDDACEQASAIPINGTVQHHDLNPIGDVDWIRFEATGGIRYVIEATYVGADAEVILELHNTCGGPPGFGGGQRIEFVAPVSGAYYVKVVHKDQTYGPASDYDLSVTAGDQCVGHYEPNDACAASQDIVADGVVQQHSFCRPGDEDWSRFEAVAGTTYVIEALNVGVDADALLELHNSCAAPPAFSGGARIEWTCPADGTYYVKSLNHDEDLYGSSATYSLGVTPKVTCQQDGYETDDTPATAHSLAVDGALQSHNVCPAGDVDWLSLAATAGVTYTLETMNPGSEADTVVCLYRADGTTEIACDDDSGAGKASRLTWRAPSTGNYLLQVRHYLSHVAGPGTRYDVAARTTACLADSQEEDDQRGQARPIVADGTLYAHDACPAGDADWSSFSATGGTNYVIRTSELGPEADTLLYLYNSAGSQLAFNDDHGDGLASQISYELPASGTYNVMVQHYDATRFGHGTEFKLSAYAGTPPATPPPTATPSPTPSPTPPPPSESQTLILVNRSRLAGVYGAEAADSLLARLQQLAAHSAVAGEVLQIENNAAVAGAYAAWQNDLLNNDKANAVAAAIRGLAMDYAGSHTALRYIILVGGDWIIPFRRVPDTTEYPESRYSGASANTTVGAACSENKTLTDDYYADRDPIPWNGRELYIPDYAIGRLVENPSDIASQIDTFLGGSQVNGARALVTGYDFVQDAANEICATLTGALGSENLDCTLIGSSWSGVELKQKQLHAAPAWGVQSINGHADHATEGAPASPPVTAGDVAAASADLRRAVVFTVGCHSGMNVPPETETQALDLAQAFAQKGANYVANTGYGWGIRGGVGLSERLMSNYATELFSAAGRPIGIALMEAKQTYYENSQNLSVYDEKILIESTLYGLPQYAVGSGREAGREPQTDPFPSVQITASLPFAGPGLSQGAITIGLPASFSAFDPESTADGDYLALDGYYHISAGEPIQPYFFAPVTSAAGPLRGVVLTYAHFQDQPGFDPVIARPSNEYAEGQAGIVRQGWQPAVPFAVRNSDLAEGASSTLVTLLGQYEPGSSTERLFDQFAFDLYYSTEADQQAPTVQAIRGVRDTASKQTGFKVIAQDASGIHRVSVAYTADNQTWHDIDLDYAPEAGLWRTSIELQPLRFFVQVVDNAGNVTTDTNKGLYYEPGYGKVPRQFHSYLPVVERH